LKKRLSLRTLILGGLLVFSALILALTYIFQNALLESFYIRHRINSLIDASNDIASNLDSDNLKDIVRQSSMNNEVCVYLISSDENISSQRDGGQCALNLLSYSQTSEIMNTIEENNGEYLFADYPMNMFRREGDHFYIYGKSVVSEDATTMILVSAVTSPIDSTIKTLQDQFWVLSAIVIAVAVTLGIFASKKLINPLLQLRDEAEDLSQGGYDASKVKASFAEIEDLNQTLDSANNQIKRVDKTRRELLANVSHDLRTPLTMIVGYAEMIKDFKEEDPSDNADVIITEAGRLSSLVDDLLDVSRLEDSKLQMQKEDYSLKEFINEIYRQYKTYCSGQDIDFTCKLPEYDSLINIDKKRIQQVIYNFLNNALNYNNKENKIITLKAEYVDDNYCQISVYDNGEGIDKLNLPYVWDRYYKVDKEHKRQHLGSGIGLSLAKDILIAHDFEYGVDSKEGEYSLFYFKLPYEKVNENH